MKYILIALTMVSFFKTDANAALVNAANGCPGRGELGHRLCCFFRPNDFACPKHRFERVSAGLSSFSIEELNAGLNNQKKLRLKAEQVKQIEAAIAEKK